MSLLVRSVFGLGCFFMFALSLLQTIFNFPNVVQLADTILINGLHMNDDITTRSVAYALLELVNVTVFISVRLIVTWLTYKLMLKDYQLLCGMRYNPDYVPRHWMERRAFYEALFSHLNIKHNRCRG